MGVQIRFVRHLVRVAGFVVVLAVLSGCRGAGEYTDSLGPLWWRGNLWGPEAHEARRFGRLPEIPYNPEMLAWEDFATRHLRTGDILFREADARVLAGLFPFSKIAGRMADSHYTHTGIFAWEDGEPVVYDTSMGGARRQRFGIWVLDNVGHFGIKRPGPGFQHHVPGAIAYCRRVYQRQVPFDSKLSLSDSRLYCAEMTSRAYQSAGLTLTETIRMGDLPRIGELATVFFLARLVTPLHPDHHMYAPGNEQFGIWSSPNLDPVYIAEDGSRPDESCLVVLPSPQAAAP